MILIRIKRMPHCGRGNVSLWFFLLWVMPHFSAPIYSKNFQKKNLYLLFLSSLLSLFLDSLKSWFLQSVASSRRPTISPLLNPMASPCPQNHLTSLIISFFDRYLFQVASTTTFPFLSCLLLGLTSTLTSSPLTPPQRSISRIYFCVLFLLTYTHFPGDFTNIFCKGPDRKYFRLWDHMVLAAITHHLWYYIRKATIDNVNKWAWLWLNKTLFYKEATGHSWSTCHSLLTHLMPPMCAIHIANSHYCRN